MGIENPVHLIFIAAIALIFLGPRRLPELAKALGHGIREFREAIGAGADGEGIGAVHQQQEASAWTGPPSPRPEPLASAPADPGPLDGPHPAAPSGPDPAAPPGPEQAPADLRQHEQI